MCGLFGYIGKRSANPLSIKLLWALSQKRGDDSTGIYRSGKIYKEWYSYSKGMTGKSLDVVYGLEIPATSKNHLILGHCRTRSVGSICEENTHPFRYVNSDGDTIIFAHNGTIKNIETLAKEYGITKKTDQTDSEVFGNILAEGNWDVLLKYRGFAAFSMYNETKDILYLWKGFSKETQYVDATEERPLSIAKRRNGYYWCSDPLMLLSSLNSDKDIESLKNNILYTLQGSRIVDSKLYDRSEVVSIEPVTTTKDANDDWVFRGSRGRGRSHYKGHNKSVLTISRQPNPQNIARGNVYEYQGLYYRQGHPLTGIIRIAENGKPLHIDDGSPNSEVYYFFEGYMLKNYDIYLQFLNKELTITSIAPIDFSKLYMHPQAIIVRPYREKVWCYNQGTYLSNVDFEPIFGYYTYHIKNDSVDYEIMDDKVKKGKNKNKYDSKTVWEEQFSFYD